MAGTNPPPPLRRACVETKPRSRDVVQHVAELDGAAQRALLVVVLELDDVFPELAARPRALRRLRHHAAVERRRARVHLRVHTQPPRCSNTRYESLARGAPPPLLEPRSNTHGQ